MKQARYTMVAILCTIGILQAYAQDVTLPEISVMARNYKYLQSVNSKATAQPVRLLEQKAAAYDVRDSKYYDDEYDNYYISFFLPDGYVLAVYDQDGKLLRTAERFKNVALPSAIRNSVEDRYPKWIISDDIYVVKYQEGNDSRKIYKLILQNGEKNIRVKMDDQGEFL